MLFLKITAVLVILNIVSSQQQLQQLPCSNFVSTKESTCHQIFQQLEKQIIGSDANLYSLRKVFYPTSQTQPVLLNVSYDLVVSSTHNRSCPGDPESPANPRYDHLPENARRFVKVHAWSSKIFYTIFHPATVNRLQPQVLQTSLAAVDNAPTRNLVPTALSWTTVGPILTVEVSIDLQLNCWPTFAAVEGSLNDLTSVLKVYADSQENVSSWGAEERGYGLLGYTFADRWWFYIAIAYPYGTFLPLINLILSVILTLIITFSVYYALWNVAPARSEERNFLFSHSVVWTGVALLCQINFVVLFHELQRLSIWCAYEDSCVESAASIKIVWILWMCVYMIIAFVVLLVRFIRGRIRHRKLFIPEWRAFLVSIQIFNTFILLIAFFYQFVMVPLLKVRKIRSLWIHLLETLHWLVHYPRVLKSKPVLWKIVHFSAIYVLYMTVFVSASIVSFSIIPILLQAFLYPFRIIAAYSYFFAAFAVYAMAAFMATFLWKEKPPTRGRLLLYISLTTIAMVVILIMSVPFITLYQLLVSGSFTDNPLILLGASVLPSLLLSSPLVWLFKSKLLPRFLEVEEDEDEEMEESKEKEKKGKKSREKEERKREEVEVTEKPAAEDTGDVTIEMESAM